MLFRSQKGLVRQQVRGMKDFDGFYQKVSEVSFEEDGDILAALEEAAVYGGLQEARIVFLILHRLDGRVMEMTEKLAARGTAVAIYAVTDENIRDAVKQGGARRKIVQVPIEKPLEGRL